MIPKYAPIRTMILSKVNGFDTFVKTIQPLTALVIKHNCVVNSLEQFWKQIHKIDKITLIPEGNDIFKIFLIRLLSTRLEFGSNAIKKAGSPMVSVDTKVKCIGSNGYLNVNSIVSNVNRIEKIVFVKKSVATL